MTHPEVLAAIARTRVQGLHWWGQLHGITRGEPVAGGDGIRLRMPATPSTLAHGTLTDLCLGLAVRKHLTDQRLVTASLSMQHVVRPRGAITCSSRIRSFDGTRALVHAELSDEHDQLVATAQGRFLVLPVPVGRQAAYWALDEDTFPDLRDVDLTETEREVAAVATAARDRAEASGTPLVDELLQASWRDIDDGASATIPNGPHLGNRIGDVQGGALYGIAATVAGRAAGCRMTLTDGAAQYLRPGRGAQLVATARVRKQGRSAAFVEVDLDAEAGTALAAQFTFLA